MSRSVFLLLIPLWTGCASSEAPVAPALRTLQGTTMGTTWTVTYSGDAEPGEAIAGTLADVDAAMSTWRDDSELSRARAADGPVAVSASTATVVRTALDLAEQTGGAFDPTVEPLVELWGFRGERRSSPPTDDELAQARARVGWQKVSLQGEQLDTGGTALDLSAIAKGYAVDQVGAVLTEAGAEHWMVEVGGEVRTRGGKPDGGPWRLGVDTPDPDKPTGTALAEVVQLREGALATSGNYRNFYELDGQRVVHTLDPRVGRPVQTEVLSATVIAPDCMSADGLATALMVLGQQGLPLIEGRDGVEALLLLEGGARVESSGMAGFLGR